MTKRKAEAEAQQILLPHSRVFDVCYRDAAVVTNIITTSTIGDVDTTTPPMFDTKVYYNDDGEDENDSHNYQIHNQHTFDTSIQRTSTTTTTTASPTITKKLQASNLFIVIYYIVPLYNWVSLSKEMRRYHHQHYHQHHHRHHRS